MLDTLPFSETLSLVLMGDGNCAETVWTFLGFSIPEQTLALFAVTTVICLWQTLRIPRRIEPVQLRLRRQHALPPTSPHTYSDGREQTCREQPMPHRNRTQSSSSRR